MDCCFAPGEVVIAPKRGGPAPFRYNDVPGPDRFDVLYSIEDILDHYRIHKPREGAGEGPGLFDSLPFVGRVPEGLEIEYAERYGRRPDVLAAVPNFYVRPAAVAPDGRPPAVRINTEFFARVAEELGCSGAQPYHCGNDVKIAVIDSGVDPRVLPYPDSLMPEQYDTDAPRDPLGGLAPYDRLGHGSAVAFIINSIAPAARILPIKMFEREGTLAGLLGAIYLAEAEFRPDIYNMSLGITCEVANCPYCRNKGLAFAPGQLQMLFSLIDKRPGPLPLLVAAAGNDTRTLKIPARFPNVLPVGCSEMADPGQDTYRPYADAGGRPFLLAPGGLKDPARCIGQAMTPQWSPASPLFGTSFAAPFVTAIAARYLCATRGGNRCSPPVAALPGAARDRAFLLDILRDSAWTEIDAFSAERYGFGVVRYNLAFARDRVASPVA